jgi:hypothetical protein
MSHSSATGWLEQYSQRVCDFSSEIQLCINSADWETLATVLASRQTYLEHILSKPVSEEYMHAVRELVEGILEKDVVFQSKIQDQKNKLIELQLLLERGRRAVQAYNGH